VPGHLGQKTPGQRRSESAAGTTTRGLGFALFEDGNRSCSSHHLRTACFLRGCALVLVPSLPYARAWCGVALPRWAAGPWTAVKIQPSGSVCADGDTSFQWGCFQAFSQPVPPSAYAGLRPTALDFPQPHPPPPTPPRRELLSTRKSC
jgi:hypothetical protein